MGKTLITALIVAATLLGPSHAYPRGLEIFVDVCNRYEGTDKFQILKEGLSAFILENRDLDIELTLFGFPLKGERERKLLALFKGLNVKRIKLTESIYETLLRLDPEEKIHIVISGGKGEWDSFKERLREVEAKRLYVIGLSLPHPDLMFRLLGVASVSGGKYYNVKDGEGLKRVLTEIERKANYNLEIRVFKSRNQELTDYLMWHYRYLWISEVYRAGRRDRAIDSAYIFPARFSLPPGIYDIKVRYGNHVKWLEGIRVKRRELTRKTVNFAKGTLWVKVLNKGHEVEGMEKRPRYMWWSEVYKAGRHDEPVERTRLFPAEFNLVNGIYDVRVHYMGQDRWLKGVKVMEGKVTRVKVTFPQAMADSSTPR